MPNWSFIANFKVIQLILVSISDYEYVLICWEDGNFQNQLIPGLHHQLIKTLENRSSVFIVNFEQAVVYCNHRRSQNPVKHLSVVRNYFHKTFHLKHLIEF